VIDTMGDHYADLPQRREFILNVIRQEEERFQRTLDVGLTMLDEIMAGVQAEGEGLTPSGVIPGSDAFRLYDTYGFPLDLTRDVSAEHGFTVDEDGFQAALEEQRKRGRASQQFAVVDEDLEVYARLAEGLRAQGGLGPDGVEYLSPEATEVETTVLAILRAGKSVTGAREDDEIEVVLAATPFYVESGGQMSDVGVLARYVGDEEEPRWEIEVVDMWQPVPGLIVHRGRVARGRPKAGDPVWAVVDAERRRPAGGLRRRQ